MTTSANSPHQLFPHRARAAREVAEAMELAGETERWLRLHRSLTSETDLPNIDYQERAARRILNIFTLEDDHLLTALRVNWMARERLARTLDALGYLNGPGMEKGRVREVLSAPYGPLAPLGRSNRNTAQYVYNFNTVSTQLGLELPLGSVPHTALILNTLTKCVIAQCEGAKSAAIGQRIAKDLVKRAGPTTLLNADDVVLDYAAATLSQEKSAVAIIKKGDPTLFALLRSSPFFSNGDEEDFFFNL